MRFLAMVYVLAIVTTSVYTSAGVVPAAVIDTADHPRYAFDYAVHDPLTRDSKAQWEARDGDAVKGSYSFAEPDGSLRVVDYTADDLNGFNAVVKKLGPNLHPIGTLATVPVAIPKVGANLLNLPIATPISASISPDLHYGPTYTVDSAPILAQIPVPFITPITAPNYIASIAPILGPIAPPPLLGNTLAPLAPLYYGFGGPLLNLPRKSASVGGGSLQWDPATRSFGGWVPMDRPLSLVYRNKLGDGPFPR